jgi:hypothetical protein
MEFNFEFSEDDLKIIERLIGYNIRESTKEDIMSFLKQYRYKKKFYKTEGKYIKLKTYDPSINATVIEFLLVRKVKEIGGRINLITDQRILYTYDENNTMAFSGVSTCSREFMEKYKESEHNEVGMKSEIDPSQEYEITEITKSEYEDEIVMAVNIN